MRKLASVQEILNLSPIPNADNIELAQVKGWNTVVKKGVFTVGSKCIYFEVDSFLPVLPEYEFLRSSSFKVMGDREGFRLKTIKLRGQISQGLAIPYTGDESIGTDLSEVLGVIKYEPQLPTRLAGIAKGLFPEFIPKTDEERIQNLDFESLQTYDFTKTEKLDGSSCTVYLNKGLFGVCSRNLDLEESGSNSFWQVVRSLDLEEKMRYLSLECRKDVDDEPWDFAIQGELIGPGIQGNRYKLKHLDLKIFTVFDITNQKRLLNSYVKDAVKTLKLDTVPIVSTECKLMSSLYEELISADGISELCESTIREGFVYRANSDPNISFKVISNNFLIKED